MNTKDLIDDLYNELDITKTEIKRILKVWSDCVVSQLEEDKHFVIPELGSLDTHVREEQNSYNPYYKRYMKIPPKKVVEFNPSKKLKKHIQEV